MLKMFYKQFLGNIKTKLNINRKKWISMKVYKKVKWITKCRL